MGIQTYFAIAQRYSKEELAEQIEIVSTSPVLSGLLETVNGVLAVVNDRRQVIAFNNRFFEMLGIGDQQQLGLRPGEILQCTYARDEPSGCGTTRQCRSCGAAVAMVTSLAENRPAERVCVLHSKQGNSEVDLAFKVHAHPITMEGRRFLLLFLQDITRLQQLAALERSFFHDVNNLMSVLVGASELLALNEESPLALTIHKAALRLQHEITIQRYISEGGVSNYTPTWRITTPREIFAELRSFFGSHPAAHGKSLSIDDRFDQLQIRTDISLVLRILSNMILNAFEAITGEDEVRLWLEKDEDLLTFCVWNSSVIPKDLRSRIFQRNFSTKQQEGRGTGTFSMKLLGENILGGQVDFSSSTGEGTLFTLTITC